MMSTEVIQDSTSSVEGGPWPIDSFGLRDGSGHMDRLVLTSLWRDKGHDGGRVCGHQWSLHKMEPRLALCMHAMPTALLLVWLGSAFTRGRSSGSKGAAVLRTCPLLWLLAARSHL